MQSSAKDGHGVLKDKICSYLFGYENNLELEKMILKKAKGPLSSSSFLSKSDATVAFGAAGNAEAEDRQCVIS